MKIYYDFHIHSCLSPCGDNDMTPNNIANMSQLKGLDFIALTDHNSILNIPAILKCSKDLPLIVLPGMEIETAEEVHMLSLFKTYEDIQAVYEVVKSKSLGIVNRSEIFGEQIIMNELDEVIGYENELLVTATKLDLDDTKKLVEANNGICIPAHIDRSSYSIISNLGVIPDIGFSIVELSRKADITKFSDLNYKKIINSDAHYLEDISEPDNYIDLEEKSVECLFDFLRK